MLLETMNMVDMEHVTNIVGKYIKKTFDSVSRHKVKFGILGATSMIVVRYGYILIKRKVQKQAPGPIGIPFFGFLPWTFIMGKLYWLKLCYVYKL